VHECRVCFFTPLLLRLDRQRRPGESNRFGEQKPETPPQPVCPFKTDFSSPQAKGGSFLFVPTIILCRWARIPHSFFLALAR
jgi:hypothetical protein